MQDNNRNMLLVGLVLAIVACCCLALVAGSLLISRIGARFAQDFGGFTTAQANDSFSQSFRVASPARLVAEVQAGSIEVTAGEGDIVAIRAEIEVWASNSQQAEALLQRIRVDASQSDREVRFSADWPKHEGGWRIRTPQVHVRVTVPRDTEVVIKMDVGNVTVVGTRGDVDITADVGQVVLSDVRVDEKLQVKTDVADIDFDSALTEGAEYRFASDVGSITLGLPAESRFEIDAASDVGNVSVQFDVRGQEKRDFVGEKVRGVVGGESNTRIILRSDVGTITVHQR